MFVFCVFWGYLLVNEYWFERVLFCNGIIFLFWVWNFYFKILIFVFNGNDFFWFFRVMYEEVLNSFLFIFGCVYVLKKRCWYIDNKW